MNRLKSKLKKFEWVLSNPFTKLKLYSLKSSSIKKIIYILIETYNKNRILTRMKDLLKSKSFTKKALAVLDNELSVHSLSSIGESKPKRFQGDVKLSYLIDRIIKFFNISSFIETGTHLGGTSSVMAILHPNLQIFTCEINRNFYKIAKEGLKKYKNVYIENKNSKSFLLELIKNKKISDVPLLFLDAHWYDFTPLQIEVKVISSKVNKAIYVIHDFEVPNKPEYHYDIQRRSSKNPIACNLALIKNNFKSRNQYNLLFPNYGKSNSNLSRLIGYVVIFQNLSTLFNKFLNIKYIQNNFFEYKEF